MAVSGVCSGVPEENSGKVPGKLLEIFSESRNATNSMISDTGKGKPAGNLGLTLPGPCPHLPCGVFFEIDGSSLLEFFFLKTQPKSGNTNQKTPCLHELFGKIHANFCLLSCDMSQEPTKIVQIMLFR